MTFYVDATNITGGGLIASTTDTTPVVFQGFPVTATSVPIVIQPVTITGINTTSADYAATDTVEVILGPTDDAPIGGTFTLTLGSTTSSALAYNISEDDMQTAFAALCTAEGKIAPTVTKIADGVWRVTGNADGAIGSTGVCTIDTEQLEPTSYGKVLEADLGSASDPYSLLIVVRQSPLAYASSFTISSPNYTGTLTVNTVEMYEYAQRQADDPFYVPFSIRRTRASGEVATIYGPVLVPIRKESLNPLTAIPTGFGTFTVGALLYASSTSTLSQLTPTTNGYHLVLSGGLPAWAAADAGAETFYDNAADVSAPSTTPVAVFTVPVLANTKYEIETCIYITCGADFQTPGGGYSLSVTHPASPTALDGFIDERPYDNTSGVSIFTSPAIPWTDFIGSSGDPFANGGSLTVWSLGVVRATLTIVNGANAGNVVVRIAQSSSHATATVARKSSWLRSRLVS